MKASPADLSKYVSVTRMLSHGTEMEWNYIDGTETTNLTPPNAWYKLVRSGNTFTGYRSSNGTTWTNVGSVTDASMPATIIVGLLVQSGDNSRTATATFDNVTITSSGGSGGGGQQQPPAAAPAIYSIQNFHGDTAITVGANGAPSSSVYLYDPFGGVVSSATFGTGTTPANATDRGMGWATSPSRKQETKFTLAVMQMGARVYLPSQGRFIQMDPVQGGTPNPYVYPPDPINGNDYSGMLSLGGIINTVKSAAVKVVNVVKNAASKAVTVAKKTVAIAVSSAAVMASVVATAVKTFKASSYSSKPTPSAPLAPGPPMDFTKLKSESPIGKADPNGQKFSFWSGVSAGADYAQVGIYTGVVSGCGLGYTLGSAGGPVGRGAGCLLLGSAGAVTGLIVGGIWGFIEGGTTQKDPFDTGMPGLPVIPPPFVP